MAKRSNLKIRGAWERHGGKRVYCARLTIPLKAPGESITLRTTISEREVRRRLRDACKARGVTPERVGGLFGSIGKAINAIAKNSALTSVASFGAKVAASPLGAALVPPPIAASLGAVNIAGKLVLRARAGDHEAQRIVRHAQAMASRPRVYTAPVLAHGAARATVRTPTRAYPLPGASRHANQVFRYLVTLSRA